LASAMDLVIVPVGSYEQHGPHLPLETDTIIAEAVAGEVAKRLGAVVGKSIPVGVSPEHMDFPGTKTLSEEEFKAKVNEAAGKDVVFINGHGGNNRCLRELGVRHINLTTLFKPYDHAGEIETSLIMHLRPDLVKADKIRKHEYRWPDKGGWKMKDYSESGVLGDPTAATVLKGKVYLKKLVDETVKELTTY
jgi:creatinine amidohydrolase/Fe(II)-dependent formamide hydrolase-like protein